MKHEQERCDIKDGKEERKKRKSSECFESLSIVALLQSKYVLHVQVILRCSRRNGVVDVISAECSSALRWIFHFSLHHESIVEQYFFFLFMLTECSWLESVNWVCSQIFFSFIYVFSKMWKRDERGEGEDTLENKTKQCCFIVERKWATGGKFIHSQNVLFVVKNVEICIIHMQQQTSREARKLRGEPVFV